MKKECYGGIPLGEVVWGFAYDSDTLGTTVTLKKEPVQGVILKNETDKPRSWRDDYHFYEIGKSGKIKKSSKVRVRSRWYARTEEDAIKGYNNLIEIHIKKLQEQIEYHTSHLIKKESE